jgi:hypothetical protein
MRAQTQWIVGSSGLVGLNYTSLDFLFKIYAKPKRLELFQDIQEIEIGALEQFQKAREKKAR